MFWTTLVVTLFGLKFTAADHDGSSDPLDWLREGVPGEPGVDYPIFDEIQDTSFTCAGKLFGGYYADQEMQCQGYHVCLTPEGSPTDRKTSFLCPNGTIFNQQLFTCDWWFNVDCNEASNYYSLNEKIGDADAVIGEEGAGARQSQGQKPGKGQPGPATSGSQPTGSRNQQPSRQTPALSGESRSFEGPGNPGFQKPSGSRSESGGSDEQGSQAGGYKQTGGQENSRPKQGQGQNSGSKRPSASQQSQQREIGGQEQISSEDLSEYNQSGGQPQGGRKQPGSGEGAGQKGPKGQTSQGGGKKQSQQSAGGQRGGAQPGSGSGSRPRQPGDDIEAPLPAYGVSSSSVQGSKATGQNQGTRSQGKPGGGNRPATNFEQKFDIVQYDATIPDSMESDKGVPVLLADPFSDFQDSDSPQIKKGSAGKPKGRPNAPNQAVEQPNFLYDPPKRG